jgi:hypothetical protein
VSGDKAPIGQRFATAVAAALVALLTARLVLSVTIEPSRAEAGERRAAAPDHRASREITGSVPAGATRLRLDTALGQVRLRPAPGRETVYRVVLRATGSDEADAGRRLDTMVVSATREGDLLHFTGTIPPAPQAARGLGAEFDIQVPPSIRLIEVVTGGGDIDATGTPGRLSLRTRGGTITGSDLAGPIEAETHGGRIQMDGLGGTARLRSAGGGVVVEEVGGDLVVRTSGGDVRVARAGSGVQVESGGGNVRIERAGGVVRVATGGGNIDVGTAAGQVSAATAGGAIHVGQAAGVRCETAAGPIVLGSIAGPIRAISSAGNIRALLGKEALSGDSDIQTWHGDVFVALPEDLAVTIRALVDNPVGKAIHSDFPLAIQRELEGLGRPLETGEAKLMGGGPLLRLRTLGGRIVIQNASNISAPGDSRPRTNEPSTEEQ